MKIYHILILLTVFLLVGCNSNQPAADSPRGTFQQYVEAAKKKDIEKMKSLLSTASLKLLDDSTKRQNTTTDEVLKKGAAVQFGDLPETDNEKIEGETATLDVKNKSTGNFEGKLPFVRENGVWKIALDKYVEEINKKTTEEINKKLANSSLSNSNSAVNTPSNK